MRQAISFHLHRSEFSPGSSRLKLVEPLARTEQNPGAIRRYDTGASARSASFQSFSPLGGKIVSNRTLASVARASRRVA